MLEIPNKFRNVEYVSSRIPGIKNQEDISLGTNCQVFVYNLLKHLARTFQIFDLANFGMIALQQR